MIAVLIAFALLLAVTVAGSDADAAPEPTAPEPIDGSDDGDDLSGTGGDDLMHGRGGDDTIQGFGGDDTITGDAGDDYIRGGDGDDLVWGGRGNDHLRDRDTGGDDTMRGGAGDDTFDIQSPDGRTLAFGGADDDSFLWTDGEATLDGGTGDDSFTLESPDQDYGLNSGWIDGGGGRDIATLPFYSYAQRDLVFRADGRAQLTDGTDTIDIANVEEFHLGVGDYLVDASQTTTGVHVVADHDVLFGGDVTLLGGSGNDTLIDGNVIEGGAGDDVLGASQSGSTLTGGEGNDTFAYEFNPYYEDDHGWYGSARATITDFNPAEDRLDLTVSYIEDWSQGPDSVHFDPPGVSIVDDPDNNQTIVMVGSEQAMVLQGVTGLDPSLLNVTYNPY